MHKYQSDMGWVILFTDAERAQADEYGHHKHDKSERDGRRADWYDGSERHNHADGVAGEMAVSFYLGKPFEFRIDTFKAADVGRNYEVRTTKVRWFDLKVKDRDRDERIVIALRKLSERAFLILGWMTVKEAKIVGEKKDPGDRMKPAYFVAPGRLHPIETLPEESK
jgi:hypothetical protein